MNPNKYKRDYRYKSDVGDRDSRATTWSIVIGIAIVLILYFLFK